MELFVLLFVLIQNVTSDSWGGLDKNWVGLGPPGPIAGYGPG